MSRRILPLFLLLASGAATPLTAAPAPSGGKPTLSAGHRARHHGPRHKRQPRHTVPPAKDKKAKDKKPASA